MPDNCVKNYISLKLFESHKISLFFNRRYDDKADANMDLDDFLVKAYAKQIKELNSSTGKQNSWLIFTHFLLLTEKL